MICQLHSAARRPHAQSLQITTEFEGMCEGTVVAYFKALPHHLHRQTLRKTTKKFIMDDSGIILQCADSVENERVTH